MQRILPARAFFLQAAKNANPGRPRFIERRAALAGRLQNADRHKIRAKGERQTEAPPRGQTVSPARTQLSIRIRLPRQPAICTNSSHPPTRRRLCQAPAMLFAHTGNACLLATRFPDGFSAAKVDPNNRFDDLSAHSTGDRVENKKSPAYSKSRAYPSCSRELLS